MQLKDIMVKDVVTVGGDETVTGAAKRMKEAGVGCLLVLDAASLQGIVTDRDLLVGCLGEGHDPSDCTVSRHMSRTLITAEPVMEVQEAAHMLVSRKIKRLPILEGGRLVGLVSFSDIGHSMG